MAVGPILQVVESTTQGCTPVAASTSGDSCCCNWAQYRHPGRRRAHRANNSSGFTPARARARVHPLLLRPSETLGADTRLRKVTGPDAPGCQPHPPAPLRARRRDASEKAHFSRGRPRSDGGRGPYAAGHQGRSPHGATARSNCRPPHRTALPAIGGRPARCGTSRPARQRERTGSCPPPKARHAKCRLAGLAKRRSRRGKATQGARASRTSSWKGPWARRSAARRPCGPGDSRLHSGLRRKSAGSRVIRAACLSRLAAGRHKPLSSNQGPPGVLSSKHTSGRTAPGPADIAAASTSRQQSASGRVWCGPRMLPRQHQRLAELPQRPGKAEAYPATGPADASSGSRIRRPSTAVHRAPRLRAPLWQEDRSVERPPRAAGYTQPRETHPSSRAAPWPGQLNTSETPSDSSAGIPIGPGLPSESLATRRTPATVRRQHQRRQQDQIGQLGGAKPRQPRAPGGARQHPEGRDSSKARAWRSPGRARRGEVSRRERNSIGSGPQSEGIRPWAAGNAHWWQQPYCEAPKSPGSTGSLSSGWQGR